MKKLNNYDNKIMGDTEMDFFLNIRKIHPWKQEN